VNARPPGAVWQVMQLPIAASSPPRLTRAASKLPGAGRRTGSIAGRHASAAAAPPAITTMTMTIRRILRNIRHLGRHLNPRMARRVPASTGRFRRPVASAPRQAVVSALAFEVRRGGHDLRARGAVESVDVEYRVARPLDRADDDRNDAAAEADVKVGGPAAEAVAVPPRVVGDWPPEAPLGMRDPHAAMFRAELAAARARGDGRRGRGPLQCDADVAAVAARRDGTMGCGRGHVVPSLR